MMQPEVQAIITDLAEKMTNRVKLHSDPVIDRMWKEQAEATAWSRRRTTDRRLLGVPHVTPELQK
jgi:hypothetical protein